MLSKNKLASLHTNQRLLVIELQKRGVKISQLDSKKELLEAKLGDHREFLLDRDSSIVPYASSIVAGDKYLTKILLKQAKISVPKGQAFTLEESEKALIYANNLKGKKVVKPKFGSHGYDVYMNLESLFAVKNAIKKTLENRGKNTPFIIEKQFEGKEYRIFIDKHDNYAVLHRDPAHVIGNGKDTIKTIAKKESYKRMNPRNTCLCPIMLDEQAQSYLTNHGKSFEYIPSKGEKVYLRANSNVAMGGMCEDYTNRIHPSVIQIAKKTLKVFNGLPYAGIDFMSKDITLCNNKDDYNIIEVNSVPGIHMHIKPGIGKSQNVAKYIANMIFPETI